MEEPLVIRKKTIGDVELDQIRNLIHEHWNRGRTFISKELCRLWGWRQDNGALKDQVCRLLLRQLEDKGLIELPPRLRSGVLARNRQYYSPPLQVPLFAKRELQGTVSDLPRITLKLVRRSHDETLWNYLVHRYHYQGYRIIVGAHIKVMACADDVPVACLSLSSSVFRIQSRDDFIGWSQKQRNRNIRHVANNSRFLILHKVAESQYASDPHKALHWLESTMARLCCKGGVTHVIAGLKRMQPSSSEAKEQIRKTINYLERNKERIHYREDLIV